MVIRAVIGILLIYRSRRIDRRELHVYPHLVMVLLMGSETTATYGLFVYRF